MRRPLCIAIQGRQPHGLLGGIITRIMARETAADNERAIALLDLKETDHVLDVGTGHGRSLGLIAAAVPRGLAAGVDLSTTALGIAKRRHRQLIRNGRVRLHRAASDALPFADATFDKAITVHTIYFWSPIEPHLSEIARVLKPKGKLVLAFRPAEDSVATRQFPPDVYTFRSRATVEAALQEAGLAVGRFEERQAAGKSMVWLTATK